MLLLSAAPGSVAQAFLATTSAGQHCYRRENIASRGKAPKIVKV
jgi:hypothetical protein